MSEWMPISTAPKDGTRILCFAPDLGGINYYGVARWAERDPDFPNTVAGWFWPFAIRPTHWMPLPPPPRTQSDRITRVIAKHRDTLEALKDR